MAGIEHADIRLRQIVLRPHQELVVRILRLEMEAADDHAHVVALEDLLRVLDDVAYSAVGAAGYDHDSLVGVRRQRRVVEEEIVRVQSVDLRLPQGRQVLEGGRPFDLAEEDDLVGEPIRLPGPDHLEPALEVPLGPLDPDVRAAVFLRLQRVGVAQELLPPPARERARVPFQAPGMIQMPMRQHDIVDRRQVDLEPLRVPQRRAAQARVEEDFQALVLDMAGETGLAQKVVLIRHVVVDKDSQLHGLLYIAK